MIIVEGSEPSEYYRWRYWEEVSSARVATSQQDYERHVRLADFYRTKLVAVGSPLQSLPELPPFRSKS